MGKIVKVIYSNLIGLEQLKASIFSITAFTLSFHLQLLSNNIQ